MNAQAMINKLILAFSLNGIDYKINQEQFWSLEFEKVCTKYILFIEHPKDDGLVFYSKIKLLKYLADEYKRLKVGDSS